MKFSAVIIARNEEKVIERLLKSLDGVDDIIVLDTGSTDSTVEIAKKYGRVEEVGSKFIETPTEQDIKTFEERYGFTPTFTTDSKLFNYAAARNYAMSLAKYDWCFQPDADEVVEWDLEEVRKLLPTCDHLTYRFAFAHNPDGTAALEFAHSKFFRKSKLKWVKKVHEIHAPVGEPTLPPVYTDKIYHHHYQIQHENRANYLPKLEYAILEDFNDDRNTFYLGREYFYNGQWEKAIKIFNKYETLNGWTPEQSQAYIYIAQCYANLGNDEKAVEYFYKAIAKDSSRREPFFYAAEYYAGKDMWKNVVVLLAASLEVDFNPNYYINEKNLYTWRTHDLLAQAYFNVGKVEKAREQWVLAARANPTDQRILSNFSAFLPSVSIIVPTLNRKEGLERLKRSIDALDYDKNKIQVVIEEGEGTVPEKVSNGLEKCYNDYVAYMADDTEFEPDSLKVAVRDAVLNDKALVAFDTGVRNSEGYINEHFIIRRDFIPVIGQIFDTDFHHVGCDDLLWKKCEKLGQAMISSARVKHHHFSRIGSGTERDACIEKGWSKESQDRETLKQKLSNLCKNYSL